MTRILSIRQPWAYLIVSGQKPVENRKWCTKIRGRILIHAAQKIDVNGYNMLAHNIFCFPAFDIGKVHLPPMAELQTGGIIGEAEITGVLVKNARLLYTSPEDLAAYDSPFFTGPYGFVLRNAKPLPYMPCRGQLRFFKHHVKI